MNNPRKIKKFGRNLILFMLIINIFTLITVSSKNTSELNNIPNSSFGKYTDIIASGDRNIYFEAYGTIKVVDSLNYYNDGSETITAIYFSVDDDYISKMNFISAKDTAGSSLSIQEMDINIDGHQIYCIYLNQPLLPGATVNLKITAIYFDMIDISGSYQTQICSVDFNVVPYSPYEITEVRTGIYLPEGATANEYAPISTEILTFATFYTRTAQDAFSTENVYIEFTYEKTFIEFTSINRRVDINSWGILKVTETQKVKNIGLKPIATYEFTLPANAINLTAYDQIGSISGISINKITNDYEDTVNVSVNLAVDRSQLIGNSSAQYTIEYYLPISDYLSSGFGSTKFKIDINILSSNLLIRKQTTSFYIYAGKELVSSNFAPNSIDFDDNSLVITYTSDNVIGLESKILYVEYKENGFQMIFRGIIISLLLLVCFSAYSLVRLNTKNKSEDEEDFKSNYIPEKEIREFASLYEEMNAIRIDLQKLDELVARKKIAKKAYSKQKKTLNSKMLETKEEIVPFKKLLLGSKGRIQDIIHKLDLKEAELISNLDSIRLHDDRYKKGKLPSKRAYNTLKEQMLKNSVKIQKTIDKLTNELKAYLI